MILLTGAAGFIGSHFFDALSNTKLLLVDKPQHFRERNTLPSLEADLGDWSKGNHAPSHPHKIIDREYLPKILEKMGAAYSSNPKDQVYFSNGEKVDWVLHIGACTDTAETRKDFLDKWNVDYSKSLWNWCAKHKVPLIYASSGATYGAGEFGFSDSWDTAKKLKPLNAYGQSKQDFDLWAKQEADNGNAPPFWYGLKFFNVYGPRESHKGPMASAILHSFKHIQKTGRCRLFRSHNPNVKDGEQSRDFIHVQDIIKLTQYLMEKKPTSGLYNCGTGKARTFYSMMEALFSALNMPMNIEWVETPEQYRKAYQYFTEAEMEKMKKAGYAEPFFSLEEGVSAYVKWLLENSPKPKDFQ
jgi:ADP-L-glycero-D-manno-heptose 6-epimerase